jgi:hypothetical protein
LSYVWGDPKDTLPLVIGDAQIAITRNLDALIREISLDSAQEYIWADAICINQNDDEEKSWQV